MYRVRDKKHNKWITNGVYLNRTDDLVILKKNLFGFKEHFLSLCDYEYQRSIGIPDKDGVMVYEGDIVMAEIMGEEVKTLCVFSDETCSYVLLSLDSDKYYSLTKRKSRVIKVIGNVFDNPEMMR